MTEAKPVQRILRACALATMVLGLIALTAESADARPRPANRSRKSNFEANKTFGLGIMIGAPTGLSGKYYLGPDTALDFGLGWVGGYGNHRGVHVHADFLWHPISLVSADAFELPLYLGVGGRFWSFDHYHRNDRDWHDGAALGVRGPFGIAFDFNDVPIDIFFELVLVLDVEFDDDRFDDDHDGIHLRLNGALGFRYYFN
jgi:hypothetical protein